MRRAYFAVICLTAALPSWSAVSGRSARAVAPSRAYRVAVTGGLAVLAPPASSVSPLATEAPKVASLLPPGVEAALPLVASEPPAAAGAVQDAAASPRGNFAAKAGAVNALVAGEIASWSRLSPPDDIPVSASAPRSVSPSPQPRGRARLAKAALWTGAGALGLSALGSMPALAPAALIAVKGWLAWGGFSALTAARYLGPAADAAATVAPPPSPAEGRFAEYRTAWRRILHAFDAQKTFESRVGGARAGAFKDWLAGGLRAGVYAVGGALVAMLAGGAVAKLIALGTAAAATSAAASSGAAAVATAPFWSLLGAALLPALLLETLLLKAVFDGGRAVLGRFLTPRRAALTAGGAAVLLSVGATAVFTTSLSVLLPVAGIEAALLWAYARSGSLLAVLAARAGVTVLAMESLRAMLWLKWGAAGVLAGLPAWTGGAVAGLLALALVVQVRALGWRAALAAPGRGLAALGERWRAPSVDGRPKSFFPILKSGLLWGLVTYAVGDLAYRAAGVLAPPEASLPGILVKVLTGPLDIVLFNFVLVGFLEEFVFRRNLFRPLRQWLETRRLSPRAVFWAAGLLSSLIFSFAHYIDFTPLLAQLGLVDGAVAADAAGAYDWGLASFVARVAAGLALAYQYWRSGVLLIPITAHFAANTMEGLGLRWGVEAFLLVAVGALLLQLARRGGGAGDAPPRTGAGA